MNEVYWKLSQNVLSRIDFSMGNYCHVIDPLLSGKQARIRHFHGCIIFIHFKFIQYGSHGKPVCKLEYWA